MRVSNKWIIFVVIMEIKNTEELVKYLKSLREQQNISVNKIATLIGTSHRRVKEVEAGESEFRTELMIKYIIALGCKLELVPAPTMVVVHPDLPEVEVVKKKEEQAGKKIKKNVVIEEAD